MSEVTKAGLPRKRVGHNAPLTERILLHTDRSGDCWLWTAAVDSQTGYGRLTVKAISNSSQYAHRIAYQAFVGPIPQGMSLDHLCRVRRCCNPAHLEPVTDLVNMRRGMSPGAIAQRRDVCFHGVHDYATHGVTYKDGRRHCRECDRIRASLWSRMSVEERSERKAAGLPIVDLAAHYAEQAAA